MKTICIIFYIVSTLVYIAIGDSSLFWNGFNMITLLLSMAMFLYYSSKRIRVSALEKWLINYAISLTFGRIAYTFFCIFSDSEWVYKSNSYFVYIFFSIFIGVIAINYIKVKK